MYFSIEGGKADLPSDNRIDMERSCVNMALKDIRLAGQGEILVSLNPDDKDRLIAQLAAMPPLDLNEGTRRARAVIEADCDERTRRAS
jgi:hypothetical protein